jgi:hypothetical protein
MARAAVKVSEWSGIPASNEMMARLAKPWPEPPPAEMPAPEKPARKRAKQAKP